MQIDIDQQNPITPARGQPGCGRELMSMIAHELDTDHVPIQRRERDDRAPGAIPRAIIHEHDFITVANEILTGALCTPVKLREHLFFVEARATTDRRQADRAVSVVMMFVA